MILNGLNQTQAAALLSVSPRTLRDWADAPRNPDGTYNAPAMVAYYVAKLSGDDLDLNKERARLAKEQADRTALANAVARGDVILASDAVQQWTDAVIAARAKLLSMPGKLGVQLTNLPDANVIAAAIKAAVYEALTELARWEPGTSSGAESLSDVDTATGPDGEPVGGRRAPPKQRKQRGAGAVAN